MNKTRLNKAAFAALNQKIAAAIFSAVADQTPNEYGPMYIFPAISFKVRHCLTNLPDPSNIHVDELYKISKELREEVVTILKAYDIMVPHFSPVADKIEKAALAELEGFISTVA